MPQDLPVAPPGLFRSFWLGGFEAASQRLCSGERVDMLAATGHDRRMTEDFRGIKAFGMHTARESLRWHRIDRGKRYDFSTLTTLLKAARQEGIQLILSLCHYGWPDGTDVFRPAFVDRFARYCRAVAQCVAEESDAVPFYNPVNEISFLSYAAADAGFMAPCQQGRGVELKQQLVRAAIAGSEAIWSVDPRARIVHIDPIIQVVAPPGRPDLARQALIKHNSQYEAFDMLAGLASPALGGDPRYLDIIGINYYHNNQWELEGPPLSWEERLSSGDKRWLPFHMQIETMYHRYRRPLFVAETSHFGIGRGPWIRLIAEEVRRARQSGVPVEGICIYPIIDRHEWHNPEHWHNSGLWEVDKKEDRKLRRVLNEPYARDLRQAQKLLAEAGRGLPAANRGASGLVGETG